MFQKGLKNNLTVRLEMDNVSCSRIKDCFLQSILYTDVSFEKKSSHFDKNALKQTKNEFLLQERQDGNSIHTDILVELYFL